MSAPRPLSRAEEWFGQLRLVMRALPDMDSRQRLAELWRDLRNTIEEQRQAPASAVAPPRPVTSVSVVEMRDALTAALREEAEEVGEQSMTLQTLQGISAAWAATYIEEVMLPRAVVDESTGCWLSTNAPSHEKGYVKQNLRNTTYYAPVLDARKLGINPYVHQLAAVASGQGDLLPLTSPTRPEDERFECSHLCHRHNCFNPAHVLVEPRWLNLARNACRGRFCIRVGGTIVNPCPHWDDEQWYVGRFAGHRGMHHRCILPTLEVPPDMLGGWVDARADGTFRRR